MERHLDKHAITAPLQDLFAGLSESIDATNAGLLLPTANDLRAPLPKVTVKDEPMFRGK
jgi:hypothetical protein